MENHRYYKSREEFTKIRLRIEISKENMAEEALLSINRKKSKGGKQIYPIQSECLIRITQR